MRLILVVLLESLLLFIWFPLFGQNVLILYDGPEAKSEAFKSAAFISRLLDHFEIESKEVVSVKRYQSPLAHKPDFLFLVFEEGHPDFSSELLGDLMERKKTTVWIHMHIDHFLESQGEKLGLAYDDWEERTDWRIVYKGQDFPKEDPGLNRLKILEANKVAILAQAMSPDGRSYPYALRSGSFWYFADSPFSYALEGGRFLIFADLLHDILGQNHSVSRRALLRIEDINPEDDPRNLRRLGRWLKKEKIPFALSLIPIFRDPSVQKEIRLSERPKLVKVLKELTSWGGTIVLHGATHQHQGKSGEDYEFWDDLVGQPVSHESQDWVEERIKSALEECQRCGLYPLAWETPHYSASQKDYRLIGKFFDSFYDRIMAAELVGTQQIFPYPCLLKDLGIKVIPENLGYVSFEKPDPESLIDRARRMLVVRDGVASFFFHSFVSLSYLQKICQAMKAMGWEFMSLRDFACNVRTDSLWITSEGGEGLIRLRGEYVHEILIDREGRLIKESYSPKPVEGLWPHKVDLPPGALYILEAVQSLPSKDKAFPLALVNSLKKLIRPEKEAGLRLWKTAVMKVEKVSQEEENDFKSFLSVLKVYGLNPKEISLSDLRSVKPGNLDFLVVPNPVARRLRETEINHLLEFVNKGGLLLTDGPSLLAEKGGFKFGQQKMNIRGLKETTLPAPVFEWAQPAQEPEFTFESGLVLARDIDHNFPLAILRLLGKGKILFLATLFDPLTPFGLSRYPYLIYYLRNNLGLTLNVRRHCLELYFDPGLRQGVSLEKLVRHWRASGVKIIYLAAWHFYENYQFPYKYFIDLCHRFGVAVYAWFEFPQVTPLLWAKNPEWREKQVNGEDAQNGWRLPLNLFHPEARRATLNYLQQILLDYDWDGVNLAEISFDTAGGLLFPEKFTPFNDQVRRLFKQKEGFDLEEIFKSSSPYYWKHNSEAKKKLLAFRCQLIKELHLLFLEEIEKIRQIKKTEWEIIVTNYDSILHPEMIEECGVDTNQLIELMSDFPFILQIEDPARSWTELPSRYEKYIETYKKIIPDVNRLMFDINIVPWRNLRGTPFPYPQACGSELATLVYLASQVSGRVAIYSEATLIPLDLPLLSYVFGAEVILEEKDGKYLCRSRRPFNLIINGSHFQVFLNGQNWPLIYQNMVAVPAGENSITLKEAPFLNLSWPHHRFFLDSELIKVEADEPWYRLTYTSSLPVVFFFYPLPSRLLVDGRIQRVFLDQSSLILPRGKHTLEIFTEARSVHRLKSFGYFSSLLFFLLGLIAVSLLALSYFHIRKKR
ncbi:MAG: DUF2334 domain-containing protein [Candidatus Aminicenantes bacterium]|nr:DUF2334 domain-containing protein [Candidatus Aminicenantes bacterium]